MPASDAISLVFTAAYPFWVNSFLAAVFIFCSAVSPVSIIGMSFVFTESKYYAAKIGRLFELNKCLKQKFKTFD